MSSVLLFVSLLAGAEAEAARPILVTREELAYALVFNEAQVDKYLSQERIDLEGAIERIARAPVAVRPRDDAATVPAGQKQTKQPAAGTAPGYVVLMRTQLNAIGKRDVVIRCRFPVSARDRLASIYPNGKADYLIRGRIRPDSPVRESVEIGTIALVADVVDLVDCELVDRPVEAPRPPKSAASTDN